MYLCEHVIEYWIQFVVVSDGISEIASETRQTPDIILNSLGLAFHQVTMSFRHRFGRNLVQFVEFLVL